MRAIREADGKAREALASMAIAAIQEQLSKPGVTPCFAELVDNPIHSAISPIEFPLLETMVPGVPSKTFDQLRLEAAIDLYTDRAKLLERWANVGHLTVAVDALRDLGSKAHNGRLTEAKDALARYVSHIGRQYPALVDREWLTLLRPTIH
jgi:hypothetical protein